MGSGVYLLSAAGRARFGRFPEVISDDGYVRSLFSDQERAMVRSGEFTIFAPKNLQSLIKIKTRVRLGNLETSHKYPKSQSRVGGENGLRDLMALLIKKPFWFMKIITYIYVQKTTQKHALQRFVKDDFGTWERDLSSR